MEWIYYIAIGAAAGWLAGQLLKGFGLGFIGNLIVGGIGAVLGRFLFQELGIYIGIDYWVDLLITAFTGAVILLVLLGVAMRLKR